MDPQQPRSAGRPRDPGLDVAIRAAAIELLAEGGLDACALDEVARRAGVGKATIYRRWPSKEALVLDAFRNATTLPVPEGDRGSLVADARAHLEGLRAALGTPLARATRQLTPDLPRHPELVEVLRDGRARAWDVATAAVVRRAEERGEVAPGGFPELALRAAAALLTERFLMQMGPVDDTLVEELLDAVVRPHLHS
ncbi:hypothetical protein ASG36_09190 [Geodermatophilus sp. Leaf369]|uniref:TetR/AcrR family transcriptional regulator n=1 Tax=Geodermatophilus sp. Leaf369 TaxID=1736354 RepID=UPI0006F88557|nr:TetR/AcrR family transcriptional regulator [Geodermatophilus sp. Leaf369]KQS58274.1 hypothetical protein ASG36_09190 [Geodermatophilus sp. Leaf369]